MLPGLQAAHHLSLLYSVREDVYGLPSHKRQINLESAVRVEILRDFRSAEEDGVNGARLHIDLPSSGRKFRLLTIGRERMQDLNAIGYRWKSGNFRRRATIRHLPLCEYANSGENPTFPGKGSPGSPPRSVEAKGKGILDGRKRICLKLIHFSFCFHESLNLITARNVIKF